MKFHSIIFSLVLPLLLTVGLFGGVSQLIKPTPAEAQVGAVVTVVADTSANAIANTLSASANSVSSAVDTALQLKENVLDPLLWASGKTALQQITGDMIEWINSGFDGAPAFVTNLGDFLAGVADKAAASFIYGDELNLLCEPFEFNVRANLALYYEREVASNNPPQCLIENVPGVDVEAFIGGDFSAGEWEAWFEVTMSESGDPIKSYYSAREELNERIAEEQYNEERLLDYGNGYFTMKTCETITTSSGAVTEQCTNATPGKLLADAASFVFGELPSLQLLAADEFNEVLSATMNGLSNQVFQGVNGLLGLGGNDAFADNSFGDSGGSSYLDALRSDNIYGQLDLRDDPVREALRVQEEYVAMLDEIVTSIEDAEADLLDLANTYPQCVSLTMPDTLVTMFAENVVELEIATTTLLVLELLVQEQEAAESSADHLAVIDQFEELAADDFARTEVDNTEFELFYVEQQFDPALAAFRTALENERSTCAGESTPTS